MFENELKHFNTIKQMNKYIYSLQNWPAQFMHTFASAGHHVGIRNTIYK